MIKANSLFISCLFFINTISSDAQLKLRDKIPAISLIGNSIQEINLASYEGKVLLIDFWASWCGPCRKGNKKLVKLYSKLDKSKIEIIGISLDKEKTKWINAIATDKINFTQLNDPYGFDAKSAISFGVEELPSQFLFNKMGELVAINPTEEEIIKLVKN